MKSKKRHLKLKKEVKEMIKKGLVISFIIVFIILLCNTINTIKEYQKTQTEKQQTEVNNYKQCIYNQHKQKGYIIRSECSLNWRTLDQKANIKYKQIKMDLYLISIDNVEF